MSYYFLNCTSKNIELKNILIIFIFVSICFIGNRTFSQSKEDVQKMKHTENVTIHKNHYEIAKHNSNGISFVFSTFFLFYKEFISSQDRPSCNFTPSCSEYALISIKKKGLLLGILSTFDRLTRCNGRTHSHYEIDEKTGLLKDPVE